MKIHYFILILVLVLLVTCKVTNGISEIEPVLRINNKNNFNKNNSSNNNNNGDNDDLFSQVTVDANSVITSTEIQGATKKFERNTIKSSIKKYDTSTTTTIPAPSLPIESITKESLIINLNNVQSNILPTTSRPRHGPGASPQERDLPLMTLLAARRNALPRKEYRTPHRRITTTSRIAPSSTLTTSIETTSSKSPTNNNNNSRSTCERNCTKNFTKRTTASCMRRCASLQRLANATIITTTKSPSSIKSKIDEKDNNEILITDESSHGFFVVTKELNDTVNHIQDGIKISQTSTEKSHRNKYKHYRNNNNNNNPSTATVSVEDSDLQPYLFFGQKLPPPTVLRINKLNDEHPKIIEITTVTKPTDRIRIPSRRFNSNRNIIGNSRRYSGLAGNLTRSANFINTTTDASIELLIKRNSQTIIKDPSPENHSSSTESVIYSTTNTNPVKVDTPSSSMSDLKFGVVATNSIATTDIDKISTSTSSPTTTSTEKEIIIPLFINVPEEEDQTVLPESIPQQQDISHQQAIPQQESISQKESSPHQEPIPQLQSIPQQEPKPQRESIPQSQSVPQPQFVPEQQANPQQQADNNFYIPTDHFEEKPNLIIFVNDTGTPKSLLPTTTTTTTTTQIPITSITSSTTISPISVKTSDTVSTTLKSFTRTTVSSSVRSTVYPRINSYANKTIIIPVKYPDIIPSPSISSNINFTSLYQPPDDSIEDDSNELEQNSSSTISNIGIIVDNNSVTIEAHRINIATYVLAGLGMLPIVVIILYVVKTILFKRRAKDETDLDGYVTDQQPISPVRQMDDDHNDDYSTISDNEFDRKNIRFKSLLGEGNFGQVWKAEADDLSGHLGTTRIVAIKTVRSGGSQVSLKDEADIMRKLGSHTNVVTLLGTCIETEPHLLIMEYAMRGRLLSLLRAARSATNILPASVPGGRSLAPLSPRTLAGFALDISRGMEYISEKKIVHRDLAARNVLLDHNGVCKICDFGMSIDLECIKKTQIQVTRKTDLIRNNSNALENRMKFDFGGRIINHWHNHGFSNHNNNNNNNINNNNNCNEKKQHDTIGKRPALPIRWMAPEALQYHIFSTETDVWAFGIVLWEIATLGCTPYPNLSGREVVRNVPNGARPDLPKDGRHEFYDLMSRCWIKNPQHRPSFREARNEISRSICKWVDDDTATSDYMDVSGFSEDLEHGMVYFNRRISEFECEI